MITVSKLKKACEKLERKYGSDSKVVIQVLDECMAFTDYCNYMMEDEEGTLYLINSVISESMISDIEECAEVEEIEIDEDIEE